MAKGSKRKNKPIAPRKLVLNKRMKEAVIRFLEYHPARRMSKNLRRMLVEYLMYQGAVESTYLRETLMDIEGLFDLLDVAEEEWTPNPLN